MLKNHRICMVLEHDDRNPYEFIYIVICEEHNVLVDRLCRSPAFRGHQKYRKQKTNNPKSVLTRFSKGPVFQKKKRAFV